MRDIKTVREQLLTGAEVSERLDDLISLRHG